VLRRRRRPPAPEDVAVGARKAVVLWGPEGSSQQPVPTEDAPWELQEWDGQGWISHGQARSQKEAEAFFAETDPED
jgi:hypothetical protein